MPAKGRCADTDQTSKALCGTLRDKASKIQIVVFDVDGVLSDGSVYYSAKGDEIKAFNVMDGLGIKLLKRAGLDVAIITGRNSPLTAKRANDLGIQHLIQGRSDKAVALTELCERLGLGVETVAYMGDDLPDLSAIRLSGLGVTVANGHRLLKAHADVCTVARGGDGAAREFIEALLSAQNKLDCLLESYL